MRTLWLDAETYYDDVYSLRKMTPAEYIADQRFEMLGCAFIWENEAPVYVDGPDVTAYVEGINWDDTYAISHNALFDMLILSMRYGKVAAKYGCTLSMARNWISHSTGSVSLKECAAYYGMPAKWETVAKTKGINYQALCQMPELRHEVRDYAIDDTLKCKGIYERMLASGFPVGELNTIDMVVRMAAVPKFELDMGVLHQHLGEVLAKKEALLARCGMDDRANLMSDAAFAGLLVMAEPDIVLPQKKSPATGLMGFAFAKTDKDFKALLDHDNPEVQALVAARLGHKSTLEETRTQRFINIGRVTSTFPVPLKYSGAHTHRFSGDWSLNAQNLPRGGNLRRSLKAPKGKKVVSIDASQIEARINACISGQDDLVQAFSEGRDVYCEFASEIYQREITKMDELERFVGKTGILSLGYQSSAMVFQNMLRVQGNVNVTLDEAFRVVDIYRRSYRGIVNNWYRVSNEVLPVLGSAEGHYGGMTYGPCKVQRNAIWLPNGNRLNYRDMAMQFESNGSGSRWMFMRGPRPIYTYGAKVVENIVQALAFVHIMEVADRIHGLLQGLLDLAHQVHDELIYIVDDHMADQVGRLVQREMAKSPSWMPELPLAAAYKIGQNYGDVKEVKVVG